LKNKRISKDRYYLEIAKAVAQRGTCFRVKIGAIIVRDDQIVSTGYVGAPRYTRDCFERGFCLRDKMKIPHGQRYELCRSVHAEQNAIINAARAGVSLLNGKMYVWGNYPDKSLMNAFPCFICKKMIINAGLEKVVCSFKDGRIERFDVALWQGEWSSEGKDIIDDMHQYGK
jgi:dCMP deaminase